MAQNRLPYFLKGKGNVLMRSTDSLALKNVLVFITGDSVKDTTSQW